MQKAPGTYALLLRADTVRTIEVGALGDMHVSPGTYVYVGSAFGPGGLQARVGRHVRGDGSLHWHVDYLRAVTALAAVWYAYSEVRWECSWASALRQHPKSTIPLEGFGASDCDCSTHLVAFDALPSFADVRERMRPERPNHPPIQRADPSTVLTE